MLSERTDLEIVTLGEQVTPLLGPGWKSTPPAEDKAQGVFDRHHHTQLTGPNGEELTIAYRYPYRQLTIHGCFPHQFHPYKGDFSINLSVGKAPAKIAADILRRLFPDYLPAYAQAVERKRTTEEDWRKQNELADRLATLLGTTAKHNENGNGAGVHAYFGDGPISCVRVQVHSDSASLEISGANAAWAERICALIGPDPKA